MIKCRTALTISLIWLFSLSVLADNKVQVRSPNGKIEANFYSDNIGHLTYTVSFQNQHVLLPSALGLTINRIDLGQGIILKTPQFNSFDESYPLQGAHNTAQNHYNDILIPIQHESSQTEYALHIRVYNDGIAYRYNVPGEKKRKVIEEKSSWKFPPGCRIWWQNNTKVYEGVYKESELSELPLGTRIGPPATIMLPKKSGYALVSEANLVGYSGMSLALTEPNTLQAQFPWDRKGWAYRGDLETPWRSILICTDLDELVNSDLFTNLCPPPSEELSTANWISPGKATWHWWSVGGPNINKQYEWIDRTAKLGFEYYLIDDGWRKWEKEGKDKWLCLKEVIDYASSKDIKILVWVQYRELKNAKKRFEYLKKIKETGAAGLKIDFVPGERKKIIDWYEDTLQNLAEFKLLANFHGCNKPTGRQRTWPHELTREGIRGHEYHMKRLNRSLPPNHNTILPFTRYIVGYADYTPTALNPEELRGYTWAHELAQAVVLTSPLTHFADNPEFYLDHPAEEFLKLIPTVWDETQVLPQSEIGKIAAFARRSGHTWFIGIINGNEPCNITIDLNFLDSGFYQSLEFHDQPANNAALIKTRRILTSNESLDLQLKKAGGFVAVLTTQDLNH
ncbi:glycoside hydrolase family 97 catalytic domain-containing protein [Acidobacteriota bacterium]